MNLFFQIQSLPLLIFCMNNQEFLANLEYVFCVYIIKINHLLYSVIILLHLIFFFSLIRSLLVLYAYVSIKSIDWILLLSFGPKVILLISSVKTFCLSFLNVCCVFNLNLLFLVNSLCFLLQLKKLSMTILFFSR